MNTESQWASVCIRLLQGPLYADNETATLNAAWQSLVMFQQQINDYFSKIGLELYLDQADGYAFLKQKDSDELENSDELPKLIRSYPLSFEMSLLCVILREALDTFDNSQSSSSVLVLSGSEIKSMIQVYLKDKTDQTKLYRELDRYISQAVALSFLRELPVKDEARSDARVQDREYEVRRIIRAKISAEFLEEFNAKLKKLTENKEPEGNVEYAE